MGKKILFYSSVKDQGLFNTQSFYKTDIQILKDIGYQVKTTNKIFDFIFFWEYNVAFIYFYRFGLVPAIISRVFKKLVIFTGGIDALDKEYMKGNKGYIIQCILFKLCYFFSNKCIIVSTSDRNNILKLLKSNTKKLKYIPHVIDINHTFTEIPKEQFITTISWMGTIANVKRKGVDKLIYIFYEFKKIRSDFKLIVIGSLGEGFEYLESIIRRLNLSNDIIFTGSINENEKVFYLEKSKYYFQISEYEGFGIAAIEGLFLGNIVFHSNKGGLQDTVGKYGIICENPYDYHSIAKKLNEVENDYENYRSFIEKGIMHVKDNFSYQTRLEGFKNIFTD